MKNVLFVCNHNAGRSQMARAFLYELAPGKANSISAGTRPGEHVWPEVVTVMNEAGIDLSGQTPQRLTEEMQREADLAVTMGCGDACPFVPAKVVAWDLPDPAGKPIAEVREIRDLIRQKVADLIETELA